MSATLNLRSAELCVLIVHLQEMEGYLQRELRAVEQNESPDLHVELSRYLNECRFLQRVLREG